MAFVLDGSTDLEAALTRLFTDLKVPMRLRDLGIPEKDLEEIAFDVTGDVPNMAGNPAVLTISQVVKILKEFY
jgi:alcohol dehydrogenase class IV